MPSSNIREISNELLKPSIDHNQHLPFTKCTLSNKNSKVIPLENIYRNSIATKCRLTSHGVHTAIKMKGGGFTYTGIRDQAYCDKCGLEVDNWTTDMEPLTVHSQRSPQCPFVQKYFQNALNTATTLTPSSRATTAASSPLVRPNSSSSSSCESSEQPLKRQKLECLPSFHRLKEVESLKQVRYRTFSHWPHQTSPSKKQMIEAGFFCCNVGDRVICIYCNVICQTWSPLQDTPCEVHRILSPRCPFVVAMEARQKEDRTLLPVLNEINMALSRSVSSRNTNAPLSSSASSSGSSFSDCHSSEIVMTTATNMAYSEIPKRHASFATWPSAPLPSVDDLVKAGFYYTGAKTIVTCFYCNGSLQNWGQNDNPTIEHARWFPHCAYAKQLCGDDLYRKIQESKRQAAQAATNTAASSFSMANSLVANSSTSRLLQIPDEPTLSRLVAARLDLDISQQLLVKGFKLSIIKRCWEDQLRLKCDDFVSDSDLLLACTILQKQIEHIDGKKENIVIANQHIRKLKEKKEREDAEVLARSRALPPSTLTTNSLSISSGCSSSSEAEMINSPSLTNESTQSSTSSMAPNAIKTSAAEEKKEDSSSAANPCVLCLTEEKRLACIPCGHLATCVPCGHSLRSCPICRREIEAFVRVYI